jgi:hypothetical protein
LYDLEKETMVMANNNPPNPIVEVVTSIIAMYILWVVLAMIPVAIFYLPTLSWENISPHVFWWVLGGVLGWLFVRWANKAQNRVNPPSAKSKPKSTGPDSS